MILNLSDVLSDSHITLDRSVPIGLTDFTSGFGSFKVRSSEPLHIVVSYKGDKKLSIAADGRMTFAVPCDRCLEETTHTQEIHVDREVDTSLSDETNDVDGYHLDIDKLVFNELLVGWPTKILCREDCKGLCNTCGQNLNRGSCDCEATDLDPRMSVIRDIFKNFKEV